MEQPAEKYTERKKGKATNCMTSFTDILEMTKL